MDWLKRLPVVGPWFARLMLTHAWRTYERLDRVHWTRLAAAMTFTSFVALFPLLTVAAAIAAATLSQKQQDTLQDRIADQIPGIADRLNIEGLVENAGTVGLIAGVLLLFTGVSWAGSTRECLRAVWELPDEEENPLLRKVKDLGILLGLGGAVLITLAASTVATALVGRISDAIGLEEGGWDGVLLRIAALAVAVGADFLLLLYVLTLLPGVEPSRRRLVVAALTGAVGFELLKLLLSGYLQGVAAKSMYGAFGVPVALLLWINLTSKLVLFCAAWTATPSKEAGAAAAADEGPAPHQEGPVPRADDPAPHQEGAVPPEDRPARHQEGPVPRTDRPVSREGGGAPGRAAASDG